MARQPLVQYQKLVVKNLYAERFQLLQPVWDDVVLSVSLAKLLGNSDPTWAQLGTSGLYLPGFGAAAVNEVFFSIQLPHAQAHGLEYNSDLDRSGQLGNYLGAHLHWMPSTTNTGNAVFEFEFWKSQRGVAYSDDDVTKVQVTAAASGVITEQITGLSHIDASDVVDSTVIVCALRRLGNNAADTFTGVALGMSVDFHVLRDSLGSNDEYPGATGH